MVNALRLVNPRFGPAEKDAFARAVPVQVIERFSCCRLRRETAKFDAKRVGQPPDTDILQLGWTVCATVERVAKVVSRSSSLLKSAFQAKPLRGAAQAFDLAGITNTVAGPRRSRILRRVGDLKASDFKSK